jgi:hypothetical protein
MDSYQNNTQLIELIDGFIPITIENLKKTTPHWGAATPKENPAFYGCCDWHSSVHSHWQVIRAIRLFQKAPFVDKAVEVLNHHITETNIKRELKNIPSVEVPYGIAWVLLLAQELREWNKNPIHGMFQEMVPRWFRAIEPLESYARDGIANYMQSRGSQAPDRGGQHYQTAFPLMLAWDWAQVNGNHNLIKQIQEYSLKHYPSNIEKPQEPNKDKPRNYFLSPGLSEADLLRRVLSQEEFTNWVQESYFAASLDTDTYVFIEPPTQDPISHIHGLNITRAFMAKGIASVLKDPYHTQAMDIANKNYGEGLKYALNPDIGVSHWVPTYVMYYITDRGKSAT